MQKSGLAPPRTCKNDDVFEGIQQGLNRQRMKFLPAADCDRLGNSILLVKRR